MSTCTDLVVYNSDMIFFGRRRGASIAEQFNNAHVRVTFDTKKYEIGEYFKDRFEVMPFCTNCGGNHHSGDDIFYQVELNRNVFWILKSMVYPNQSTTRIYKPFDISHHFLVFATSGNRMYEFKLKFRPALPKKVLNAVFEEWEEWIDELPPRYEILMTRVTMHLPEDVENLIFRYVSLI